MTLCGNNLAALLMRPCLVILLLVKPLLMRHHQIGVGADIIRTSSISTTIYELPDIIQASSSRGDAEQHDIGNAAAAAIDRITDYAAADICHRSDEPIDDALGGGETRNVHRFLVLFSGHQG